MEGNNGNIELLYDEGTSSGSKLKMKLKEFHERYTQLQWYHFNSYKLLIACSFSNFFPSFFLCSTASFTALDRNYLTPIFTSQNDDHDDEDPGKITTIIFFPLQETVVSCSMWYQLMKLMKKSKSVKPPAILFYLKIFPSIFLADEVPQNSRRSRGFRDHG